MLSDKDRELVGIGASIASGCQPCTNFHVRAARISGANDAEIGQAVNDALVASRHATRVMAQIASHHYTAPISDTLAHPEESLIRELVSISAAYAVNSATDVETHLAAARKLGATDEQILAAIKIAEAVKRMAVRQAEKATGRAAGSTPVQSDDHAYPYEEVSEQAARAPSRACSGTGGCGPRC